MVEPPSPLDVMSSSASSTDKATSDAQTSISLARDGRTSGPPRADSDVLEGAEDDVSQDNPGVLPHGGGGTKEPGSKGRRWGVGLLRLALLASALLGAMAYLSRTWKPQLEGFARVFIEHSGYGGLFLGSLASDGFMVPLPPHFYLLTATIAGLPWLPTVTSVCAGSLTGAVLAYGLGWRLGRVPWLRRRIEASRTKLAGLSAKQGIMVIVALGASPLPFSMMCYAAGVYRLPWRYFALLASFRLPRLFFFYGLMRLGWGAG